MSLRSPNKLGLRERRDLINTSGEILSRRTGKCKDTNTFLRDFEKSKRDRDEMMNMKEKYV
jgi:hypothetical protein